MPSIESRLHVYAYYLDAQTRTLVCNVALDGAHFTKVSFEMDWAIAHHPHLMKVQHTTATKMLTLMARDKILSQWEVPCESTLIMEQKSRKTITSSCGQLTVRESHYLTVT